MVWYFEAGEKPAADEMQQWMYCGLVWSLMDALADGRPVNMLDPRSDSGWLEHWGCLTMQEQKAALCEAALAILDPKERLPNQTALIESAAAAPFFYLLDEIGTEIESSADSEEGFFFNRTTALIYYYAFQEPGEDEDEDEIPGLRLPSDPWDEDMEAWGLLVDRIMEPFFADRDWSINSPGSGVEHPELDVEAVFAAKQFRNEKLGIEADYYATHVYRLFLPKGRKVKSLVNRLYKSFLSKHIAMYSKETTIPELALKNIRANGQEWLLDEEQIAQRYSEE